MGYTFFFNFKKLFSKRECFFFGPNIIFPFSLLSPRPDTKNNTHDTQRELNNQISETKSNCNKFSKFVVRCYYSLFSIKCEICLRQHACRVCVRYFSHRSMDVDGLVPRIIETGVAEGGKWWRKRRKDSGKKNIPLLYCCCFGDTVMLLACVYGLCSSP